MQILKIKRDDIEYLEINRDYVEIKYKESKETKQQEVDQQKIQNLHEKSGKFGAVSDLL